MRSFISQIVDLPAIQAVYRAMSVAAIKGDRHSQKAWVEMVARVEGPKTKEHKEQLEQLLQLREEAQAGVNYYADQYRCEPNEFLRAQYLDRWHSEQRIFDTVNDVVPKRCKVNLENRSYASSAASEIRANGRQTEK